MTTITPHLTSEQIAQMRLNVGCHTSPKQGHCLLEVVSMFAGEPFSDSPACVDPVLTAFGIEWNDSCSDDEREQLKRYIPLLPGTAQGEALSRKRGLMALDWLVRYYTPTWLDLEPTLAEHAAKLRALPPITNKERLVSAQSVLSQACKAAPAFLEYFNVENYVCAVVKNTAWISKEANATPAETAVWAMNLTPDDGRESWIAVRYDIRATVWNVATKAAWNAIKDAKQIVSDSDAARKVTKKVLAPTVQKVEKSAHDLYLRMIEAKDE